MSDLFGNHIVGFPTRWLKCLHSTQPTTFSRNSETTQLEHYFSILHKPTEQTAGDSDTDTDIEEDISSCDIDGSHIVVDEKLQDNESDSRNKDYLTEEEALRFEPLTDVRNIVSMRQSILKMIGTVFFLICI